MRSRVFPSVLLFAVVVGVAPCRGRAAELNLATLTCGKYENEVLPAAATNPAADSINTVMWLFGYSVAKSGGHVLYPEALASFGFALDGECKSNPAEIMLDALGIVKPESKNPMDLSQVGCSAFAARHVEVRRSDPESANTIMMWLFGFSTARSGGRIFNTDSLPAFQGALLADCDKHPGSSLYDALAAVRMPKAAR
jgi:HdeA/HdeB family